MNNIQQVAIGAAVVAAIAAAIWFWKRGVAGVAEDVSSGAVQLAGGAVTGTVKGGASLIGIPDTDAAKCKKALDAGNYFDASLYCTAGEFTSAGVGLFYRWFQPPERTQ